MSSPPKRSVSTTGVAYRSPRQGGSTGGTLPRSRSSVLKKNMSIDEGDALSDLHRKADKQLQDERRKEAEAMRYWEEIKKQEQQKFSDEDSDSGMASNTSRSKYVDDSNYRRGHHRSSSGSSKLTVKSTNRPSSALGSVDREISRDRDSDSPSVSNGLETVRVWQEKYQDVEDKYKESMVSNAQLYNEKTALVHNIDSLKDRLEDHQQEMVEVQAELQRQQSLALHTRHREESLASEIESLKKQIVFRDEFLERHGLHLPTGEDDEDQQAATNKGPEMSSEEKQALLDEIASLKEEIASMRSSSLLSDQQPRDIVQVSARMVSEYKTRLQIADAENTRLEGTTKRLEGQVSRYKSQVKELEEREDKLMKEKRQQGKEIRSLQSECEDYKTEIDLLKRRIEQLRKRRDYSDT